MEYLGQDGKVVIACGGGGGVMYIFYRVRYDTSSSSCNISKRCRRSRSSSSSPHNVVGVSTPIAQCCTLIQLGMFLSGDDTLDYLPRATNVSSPPGMWINYLTYLGLQCQILRVGHWSLGFEGWWVRGCADVAVAVAANVRGGGEY